MSSSHSVPAVILQSSGPNSLGIARSLAREGVPVIATDHAPGALGLTSRYVRAELLRDPLTESEGFLDDLLALGERLGNRPVLYATHDEALATIAQREGAVRERFRVPWSPWETMKVTIDKGGQHAAAARIGFPVPGTIDPDPADDPVAAAAEAGLRYPVLLKPRYSPEFRRRFKVQVLQAAGPDELARQWEQAAEYGPQIQEIIPGADDCFWTLGSYRGANGERLASFTGHKLHQWPQGFGTARAAEAVWDLGLVERGHALLDALHFHGISQVEVKRDPRDGRDYLIEVNPRSWLWNSLATRVGVNIAYACYLDAIGRPRTWPQGHVSGRRWLLTPRHLVASARELRRRSLTPAAFARTLRPPVMDGVFDVRDPRPAVAEYAGLLKRFRR